MPPDPPSLGPAPHVIASLTRSPQTKICSTTSVMYVQMVARRGQLPQPTTTRASSNHSSLVNLSCVIQQHSPYKTTHALYQGGQSFSCAPFSAASPNLLEEVTEVGSSTVAWERNRAAEGAMVGIIRGAAKMDAVRWRLRSNACGDTGSPGLPHPLTSHQHTHTVCTISVPEPSQSARSHYIHTNRASCTHR